MRIYRIALKLFIALLPKMRRNELIRYAQAGNTFSEVQPAYDFEIIRPNQALAAKRFSKSFGVRKVDRFFGLLLNDVRLIGPYGIPVTRKGVFVLEPISERWFQHALFTTISELGFWGFAREYLYAIFPKLDKSAQFIDVGSHLICRGAQWPGGPIFGHWIAEQLPMLRGIEAVCKLHKIETKFITNRNTTSWQNESIELMGYDKSKLFNMPDKGIRVNKLILASLRNVHSRGMEVDPIARKWAASRLQNGIEKRLQLNQYKQKKVNKKICFFRQDQVSRRIRNIDHVIEFAKKKGYQNVRIGTNHSLDFIAIPFYFSTNLLTCFGSGIVNIMFMKKPKKLIEIYSTNQDSREVFFLMASEFGMEYKCVPAGDVPSSAIMKVDSDSIAYQKPEEWIVSIDDLEDAS